MGKIAIRWVLLALSVFFASLICQALGLGFQVKAGTPAEIGTLFLGVAFLALLNATLGKALRLVTLPLSCLTLGLFSLVVNALVLMFAASFELGFRFTQKGFPGFVAAFVASLLISFVNGVLGVFVPDGRDD